jgi:hypothetical protein
LHCWSRRTGRNLVLVPVTTRNNRGWMAGRAGLSRPICLSRPWLVLFH